MRKLCYFVSAAAIATGVAAFAVPASAQPFSGVMGIGVMVDTERSIWCSGSSS